MIFLTEGEKEALLPMAKDYLEDIRKDIRSISDRFFMIGLRLWEMRNFNYVEALGYSCIEELAQAEFGIERTSTYNFLSVYVRFAARDHNGSPLAVLDPEYRGYNYSQLVELSRIKYIPAPVSVNIPVSTSVRSLRAYAKYLNSCHGGHILSFFDWNVENERLKLASSVQTSGLDKEVPEPEVVQTSGLDKEVPEPEVVQTSGLDKEVLEPEVVQTSGLDKEVLEPEVVQTSGLDEENLEPEVVQTSDPVDSAKYGLLLTRLNLYKFISKMYVHLNADYLYYYCPDEPKTPYMGIQCTFGEMLSDVCGCLGIDERTFDDVHHEYLHR